MHVEHMAEHGIDDIYEAIANDEHVLFVTTSNSVIDSLYRTYLEEHYGYHGRLRPVARAGFGGEAVVWDAFVDYKFRGDGRALVETKPNGEKRGLRIDQEAGVGALEVIPDFREGGQLRGWALDPATGTPADSIVVMAGDDLNRLGLPFQQRTEIAERYGLSPQGKWGFGINYRSAVKTPEDVRVFAVFGDRAVELFAEGSTGGA